MRIDGSGVGESALRLRGSNSLGEVRPCSDLWVFDQVQSQF